MYVEVVVFEEAVDPSKAGHLELPERSRSASPGRRVGAIRPLSTSHRNAVFLLTGCGGGRGRLWGSLCLGSGRASEHNASGESAAHSALVEVLRLVLLRMIDIDGSRSLRFLNGFVGNGGGNR